MISLPAYLLFLSPYCFLSHADIAAPTMPAQMSLSGDALCVLSNNAVCESIDSSFLGSIPLPEGPHFAYQDASSNAGISGSGLRTTDVLPSPIRSCGANLCSLDRSHTVADSIIGTWQRELITTDESTGTEEKQTALHTFAEGHTLNEAIVYEQKVRWTDDEVVVLRFCGTVTGQWVANGRDILLRYVYRTLDVRYEGCMFPEHDAALQPQLKQTFEKKNAKYLRNYVRTMRNVLRNYYRRNSGRALMDVAFQSPWQFTATLGQETVTFKRLE